MTGRPLSHLPEVGTTAPPPQGMRRVTRSARRNYEASMSAIISEDSCSNTSTGPQQPLDTTEWPSLPPAGSPVPAQATPRTPSSAAPSEENPVSDDSFHTSSSSESAESDSEASTASGPTISTTEKTTMATQTSPQESRHRARFTSTTNSPLHRLRANSAPPGHNRFPFRECTESGRPSCPTWPRDKLAKREEPTSLQTPPSAGPAETASRTELSTSGTGGEETQIFTPLTPTTSSEPCTAPEEETENLPTKPRPPAPTVHNAPGSGHNEASAPPPLQTSFPLYKKKAKNKSVGKPAPAEAYQV
ncbi:hypothetical protein HPB50_029073 [Hyalomma asiaticum]|nr:hypothetical protein HPB50_029073 [Hyalomma asiaticum]